METGARLFSSTQQVPRRLLLLVWNGHQRQLSSPIETSEPVGVYDGRS